MYDINQLTVLKVYCMDMWT